MFSIVFYLTILVLFRLIRIYVYSLSVGIFYILPFFSSLSIQIYFFHLENISENISKYVPIISHILSFSQQNDRNEIESCFIDKIGKLFVYY